MLAARAMQHGARAGVLGAARTKTPLLPIATPTLSGSVAMRIAATSPLKLAGSKIAPPPTAFVLGSSSSARTLMTSSVTSSSRAVRMMLSMPGAAVHCSFGSSLPSAMLFSSMRVTNAIQPHANALVRRSAGSIRLAPARHHATAYRKQFMHSNRYGRRNNKPISGDTVVLGLISANVVVTMLWLTAHSQRKKRRMMAHFTTSALHLARGQYHTLVTSMFSHADVGHLLANMLGLFFFGRQMCDVLGPKRFLGLYLTSGVLSSWAAVYEQQRTNRVSFNLGASGAVNSITAMSILLFPHATLLLFGIVPMPAWVAGSLFIGKDAYAWATDRQDGIGHFAHLSGAFCGAAYYYYLRRLGTFRHF